MAKVTKILVVDDTITYRSIMKEVVKGLPGTELVGSAPNGRIALKKIEHLAPDYVLLDVNMPDMDGFETLKEIKRKHRNIGVIMVSGASAHDADVTIKSLEAGAIDFIPKPEGLGMEDSLKLLREKIAPLINISSIRRRVQRTPQKPLRKTSETNSSRGTSGGTAVLERKQEPETNRRIAKIPTSFDIVVIGVSTGGPEALMKVIPKLENMCLPILLVQHMPPVFTASLAKHLNGRSQVNVKEAVDGEQILAGNVYIAPGGKHMIVRRTGVTFQIAINDGPPVKSCKPSVDVMFRSVASVYGGNILSIIMTGMGDDGSDGVAAIKKVGGYSITQSEETCVVYGMPRAVDEQKLSDESIPLERIAGRIMSKISCQRKGA